MRTSLTEQRVVLMQVEKRDRRPRRFSREIPGAAVAFLFPGIAKGVPKPMQTMNTTMPEEVGTSKENVIAATASILMVLTFLALTDDLAADEGHKNSVASRAPVSVKEYPHTLMS